MLKALSFVEANDHSPLQILGSSFTLDSHEVTSAEAASLYPRQRD
jgi:hypothetical protein